MNLREAFNFVATIKGDVWRTPKGSWKAPFCYNREHALRLLGPTTPVKRITKVRLASMRAQLMQEPGRKGTRKPGGVNRIMSMVNTVLNELVDADVLDKAPRLKPLEENNEKEEYYTREQIWQMVKVSKEEFDNYELADAILFGVYTGCRQGELLSLTVGAVSLTKDTIRFLDTKNGTNHTIDIHPELRKMLEVRCEGEEPGEKVFQFRNKDDLYSGFKKARNLCGIPDAYVWHTLRHTTGTWLAENNVPIQTIAKVLNHKNVKTTERYVKVTDKARKSAINTL
jgi:integrase